MMPKKYLMFVDETGISNVHSSPFTVTGVIFEYKYAYQKEHSERACQLKVELDRFKMQCFGRTDVILHLREVLKAVGPFSEHSGVTNQQLQLFWNGLPQFLRSLDFKIISVTVDKQKLKEYFATPKDPYVVAFAHIMKCLYSFIASPSVESIRIVLESRGDLENLLMQKAFFDIFNSGTVHMDVSQHRNKIKSFTFADKNHVNYQFGCEIADLVCLPLNRVRNGLLEVKPKHINYGEQNKIFAAIKEKIYLPHQDQDFRNWGFKKVPIFKKKRLWQDDPIFKE
jgi:hypothetical protein